MSYPPPPAGPPPAGPPPKGPPDPPPFGQAPSGRTQLPGQPAPQGWPTYISPAGPPGPHGWPRPPYAGPPRRSLALLLGGIALSLVLIAGAGVGTWLLVREDDGKNGEVAGAAPSSPSASQPPAAANPEPTSAPSPSSRAPAKRPRKPPVDKHPNKLSASDFPGDWDFALGDVQLFAKYKFSHDYTSCDGIGSARLVGAGCKYAVQWTYTARGGRLVMTQVMYVMGNDQQAKSAAQGFTESDFDLPPGSQVSHFHSGKWVAKPSTKVVALSIVTTAAGVPTRVLDDYLHYGSADFSSAVMMMFM